MSSEKHFELTSEFIVNAFGVKLFRIKATQKSKWAEIGDLGGYVQRESNLSGDAWVSGNAWVYGDARVYGDAWEKSPLQIQGTMHFICQCKKRSLKIGCIELGIDEWKERFLEIGKEHGYTESQIKEYGLYIKLASDLSEIE